MIKYFFSDDLDSLRVNMWSLILRKRYGMYYSYYMNYLIDNGFISLVSDYYVSKKSKTYKINYFDINDTVRVKIYDKVLLKKFRRDYLERSITEFNSSPIDIGIRKKLIDDIYHVSIDYDKSIDYLNDLKDRGLMDTVKFYKNFSSINGIKDKNLFFKFDSHGRFHSNFTVLKKYIRANFLKIDGNDICEVDIKNSQPFFLSILMKKYMTDWTEYDDVNRYFFMVNNGIIYDDISSKYGITRNESKTIVYKVLFGKNKNGDKIFKGLYPNVYGFIQRYKETKGDYKSMSHDLQMTESNFIFNNLVRKIITEIPLMRLITVHDSIVYPCYFKDKVTRIFNNELNNIKENVEIIYR